MASRITIAENKDYFLRDGKKFFLLADTVWTGLYNPNDTEWEYYLNYRRTQSFNALQFSVNPMWDGGIPDLGYHPFAIKDDGRYDYYTVNREYFEHGKKILAMASEKGFTPMLIILHASHTAGTWAAERNPQLTIPFDALENYVSTAVSAFKEYNPLYIVAGDTDLTNELTCSYYRLALNLVKKLDPEGLTCFHLSPDTDLTDEFESSELIDFYLLQPGHRGDRTSMAYELTQKFYNKKKKMPIFCGEFFYEGHSHTKELYGRYNEFDQRRAIWQSILAGSKAGVGYGAHGLWGFYRPGKAFRNSEYGGAAFPWQMALHFKGAWEGSFAKYLYEQHDMFGLEPWDGIINEHERERNEIRASKSADGGKIVIYMPYSTNIRVNCDLSGHNFIMIEMESKHFAVPEIKAGNNSSLIVMPEFNSDFLFIGTKSDK